MNDNYFKILSNKPGIILRSVKLGGDLVDRLPDRPIYHWVFIPFFARRPQEITKDAAIYHKARPKDILYYFYNDEAMGYKLRNSDLNLVGSPIESMANLSQYTIMDDIPKKYDALMVARAAPGKRIELARRINNLRIVTSPVKNQESYYEKITEIFGDRLNNGRFHKRKMKIIYNEAKIGLSLSAAEGAQRTPMEHQLTGSPVVCTTSNGGRSKFINPETCLIVPPNEDSVYHGVQSLLSMKLDPYFVREMIFKKLMGYRKHILDLGESILNKHGSYGFEDLITPIIKKNNSIAVWNKQIEKELKEFNV